MNAESRPAGNGTASKIDVGNGDRASIPPVGIWHGSDCTPVCRERAVPSPYDRDRPPATACDHCGALLGVACVVVGPHKRPLARFGRFHPSRLEVAA
jgi:hypothetical protein